MTERSFAAAIRTTGAGCENGDPYSSARAWKSPGGASQAGQGG
ncbi:MAG TPA: hypothetical protein VLZ89_00935 [Anaerolineales bacterium]|nr:hypothetical protein [Anaerolineales bacterium]